MKSNKQNTRAKMKRAKKSRNTLPKQIAALAGQGKLGDALKLARGWRLSADPACRIVEQWQAVGALAENPKLEHGAPAGFYQQLVERAGRVTCSEVRRAVLDGDAEFFIRIAKRLEQAEPVRDNKRVAVLSRMGESTPGEKPSRKQTPGEIACEIVGRLGSAKQIATVTREVSRLQSQYGVVDK